MASLFSVSRFIGKSRTRSTKRTPSVQHAVQENEGSQSQKRVIVDSAPSIVIPAIPSEEEESKANSYLETLPKEQDFSFPPIPSRKSEVTKTHERKTEALEDGYDVVLQPSANASFGDWTELDAAKKEEQPLAQASSGTNSEKAEEPPRKSSVPDWTHLEIDKKAEDPSVKPSDVKWHQLDIDKKKKEEKDVACLSVEDNKGIISETHVEEERPAHLEEMRIVREEKDKLAGRVKELEEELQQAEHELQLKMEQVSKYAIALDRKEEEIEMLKEDKERIEQVAAREKEESLNEIRRSNEAIATRLHAAKELKVETMRLLAKQVDMQVDLDTVMEDLSESQARVAELELENESQAKKILEQDATLSSHSEVITVLKGQKANLVSQVHSLRTDAKVIERQRSMLMLQLREQSEDLIAWRGTVPSLTKSVRRRTGPTLVEQAVRTIKSLNEEIFQTAASLTDCVDEIEKRFVDEPDGTASALETLKSMLGTEIYKELEGESCMTRDEYNPFVLQTGFQACLTACCMRIITSWYPAEPEYGKFLEVVYERMRGLGGEENAAQWRKWTLQSCTSSANTGMKGVLSNFIIKNLYAMLSMSGWPKVGETANLLDKFDGKISEIVNMAVRFNTLAAETTTPGDLMATTIEEGRDYVPEDMADDTPEGGWDNTYSETPYYMQEVVGSVGLGLKWREDDMYEAQLVLKPKVVLRKTYKIQH